MSFCSSRIDSFLGAAAVAELPDDPAVAWLLLMVLGLERVNGEMEALTVSMRTAQKLL
jgi:hypothetical protein